MSNTRFSLLWLTIALAFAGCSDARAFPDIEDIPYRAELLTLEEAIHHLTERPFADSTYEVTYDSYYEKYKDRLNAEGHEIDEEQEKELRD